jgi:hypothetical protein
MLSPEKHEFIGYGDEAFGYRFWDDQNQKIIISRNVIFNELAMYKDMSVTELVTTEVELENFEFVNLDEIRKYSKEWGSRS